MKRKILLSILLSIFAIAISVKAIYTTNREIRTYTGTAYLFNAAETEAYQTKIDEAIVSTKANVNYFSVFRGNHFEVHWSILMPNNTPFPYGQAMDKRFGIFWESWTIASMIALVWLGLFFIWRKWPKLVDKPVNYPDDIRKIKVGQKNRNDNHIGFLS